MELEVLTQIKKVEVSPFLFTRIQQRISEVTIIKFSNKTSMSLIFALLVVIVLNIVIMQNYSIPQNKESEFAQSMNIITYNGIYNE